MEELFKKFRFFFAVSLIKAKKNAGRIPKKSKEKLAFSTLRKNRKKFKKRLDK